MIRAAISESGERGSLEKQPREGAEQPEANPPLTAESVSSLLKSEFAEAESEPAPGTNEVQEGERAEVTDKSEIRNPKSETNPKAEDGEVEQAEERAPEQEQGQEQEQEAPELPAELQAAIEQWEEAGKGELPAPLQALVERRIGKLTSQREEHKTAREAAEARVAQLEGEVNELRANGPQAQPSNIGALDEKQLATLEKSADKFLNEAEAYLDDSATDEERGRIERYLADNRLEPAQLKRKVREVSAWLNRTAPAQRQALAQFRQQESAFEPDVKKFFPWMDKRDAPEFKLAQEVLKLVPEMKARTPAHRIALGVYVLGLKEFAKLKGNGSPKSEGRSPKAPVKTPANGAAAPTVRVNGRQAEEESARVKFNGRMDRESVTELLKAGLRS